MEQKTDHSNGPATEQSKKSNAQAESEKTRGSKTHLKTLSTIREYHSTDSLKAPFPDSLSKRKAEARGFANRRTSTRTELELGFSIKAPFNRRTVRSTRTEHELGFSLKAPLKLGFANRKAVAGFMSKVMDRSVSFNPSQIVLTAGATPAIEMLCFCLADEGNALLVPSPYYPDLDRDMSNGGLGRRLYPFLAAVQTTSI